MTLQLPPFSYASLSLDETMKDLAVRFVLNCPPEDLSTPVRLMFQLEEANWFYIDYARAQNGNLPLLRLKSFVTKIYQTVPVIEQIFGDPNEALSQFSNYKRGIPVRGGIILNEKLDKVLLVRAWKARTWGFPRGKINKGEDDLVCAVREVYEETGFDISPYVNRQNYVEKTIEGKNFLLFYATGVPESTKFVTRTREEIEEIKWIPLSQIASRASHKFFLVPIFYRDIERFAKRNRQSKFGAKSKPDRGELVVPETVAASIPVAASSNGSDTLKELLGIDSIAAPSPKDRGKNATAPSVPPLVPLPTLSSGSPFVPNAYNGMLPLPVVYGNGIMPTAWGNNGLLPNNAQTLNSLPGPTTALTPRVTQDPVKSEDRGGQRILALLNHKEGSTEEHQLPKDVVEDPAHHIDILDQLLSSRRNRKSQHASTKPTTKPRLKQNSLLQVLNSSRYTKQSKLLDLLKPADSPSKPKNTGERAENALMKLLGQSVTQSTPTVEKPTIEKLKVEKTASKTPASETPAIEKSTSEKSTSETLTIETSTIDLPGEQKTSTRLDSPAILQLLSKASIDAASTNQANPSPPSTPATPKPLGENDESAVQNDETTQRHSLLDLLGIKPQPVNSIGPATGTSSISQENLNAADSRAGSAQSVALPEPNNIAPPASKKPNALLSLLGAQ